MLAQTRISGLDRLRRTGQTGARARCTSRIGPAFQSRVKRDLLVPLRGSTGRGDGQSDVTGPSPAPIVVSAAALGEPMAGGDGPVEATNSNSDGGGKQRWTVVSLVFLAFLLCNLDRVNLSIAIIPMASEFSWGSQTMGSVHSAFFCGYLLTQILGGALADRYGGHKVLGIAVVWWSVATCLTPFAAHAGLPVLLVARFMMGVGEGVAMPSMNALLAKWIPTTERSRSLSLVYSGMYIGSVIGLGFSPILLHNFGWPSVFWVFGSFGLVWIVLWTNFASSSPSLDARVSNQERLFIESNKITRAPLTSIPWRLILSKRSVWTIIVAHFCHNVLTFILLTWSPVYFSSVHHLDLHTSGYLSVLPWMTMALFANVGGTIADTLIVRGWAITTVRKVMQTIGFIGPAVFISQLHNVTSPIEAVLILMAAQGLDAFSQSGLYSNHQDIAPKYAGVLLGMSNTAGVLAGVLGSFITGVFVSQGSWDAVWSTAACFSLFGAAVWLLFATGEQDPEMS